MSEEAKAVQEVAKATGQMVRTAEKAGGFFAKYVDYPLEQASGILGDHLRYVRWERAQRLLRRAEELQNKLGLPPPDRTIALKDMLPLVVGATIEESDEIQDLWAALLVNASHSSTGIDAKRIYMDVLERLTPLDAYILQRMYDTPYSEMEHHGILVSRLPQCFVVWEEGVEIDKSAPLDKTIQLSIMNLAHAGVVTLPKSLGGGESYERVLPTFLGRQLVEACSEHAPI